MRNGKEGSGAATRESRNRTLFNRDYVAPVVESTQKLSRQGHPMSEHCHSHLDHRHLTISSNTDGLWVNIMVRGSIRHA
jgi:hypothetical protein